MSFLSILTPFTGLAKTWMNNKAEEKQAVHARKLSAITNDADWESKMADASASSWKDEYLIVLLTSPVIAIMYGAMTNDPELIARVQYGLEVLDLLPAWFSYLLGIGVTASFGVKGVDKFMKLKNKI